MHKRKAHHDGARHCSHTRPPSAPRSRSKRSPPASQSRSSCTGCPRVSRSSPPRRPRRRSPSSIAMQAATEWTRFRSIPAARAAKSRELRDDGQAEDERRVPRGPGCRREQRRGCIGQGQAPSKPIVRASGGKRARQLTIKGYIWPGHAVGTKAIVLNAYRPGGPVWTKKGHRRVKWMADLEPPRSRPRMVTKNRVEGHLDADGADDKGLWMFKAAHEDEGHVAFRCRAARSSASGRRPEQQRLGWTLHSGTQVARRPRDRGAFLIAVVDDGLRDGLAAPT